MNKGKQKAFFYQFTNVILILAILFSFIGLIQDIWKLSAQGSLHFLFYYIITIFILGIALRMNRMNLQNIFYRNMDAFTARTAYECSFHLTKNYYQVYIYCLLYLGDFHQVQVCLDKWKPTKSYTFDYDYFCGLLAYYQSDIQALDTAIEKLANAKQSPIHSESMKLLMVKQALLKKDYQHVIELIEGMKKPIVRPVEQLSCCFDLGLAYQRLKQTEEAMACFKEVSQGNQHLYFVRKAKKMKLS